MDKPVATIVKPKRGRKPAAAVGKPAPAVTAKRAVEAKSPVAAKPAVAAAPLVAATVAVKPAIEATAQLAEQTVKSVEAVASPAPESDIVQGMAAPSPIIERIADMATVTSPTEGFDKGQALLGDATARFKTAFEKSSKIGEDMVDFAKGNVEAVVASARVAAKAGESFGQDAADYSKRQFESATALFKSFANVKSPTELFQLQSEFAKTSFDSAVAEASRVSESLMKVAGEIAQPLSSRYAVAAEKLKANAL